MRRRRPLPRSGTGRDRAWSFRRVGRGDRRCRSAGVVAEPDGCVSDQRDAEHDGMSR